MSINTPQEIEKSPSCPIAPTTESIRHQFLQIVSGEDVRKLTCSTGLSDVVEGLLKPGVTILGGAPKRGKSLLAFDIAVAVATGGKVGQKLQATPGRALLISLEETQHQLGPKLDRMGGSESLENLSVATVWRTGRRGILDLDNFLADNPDITLVVIDIWKKFQGDSRQAGRAYHSEYKELDPIRKLAQRYGVCILLLHHENKSSGKDWMKSLYGSNAVTGAVDSVMLLARESPTSPNAVLHAVGRDIPAQDWNLDFNMDKICWIFGKNPLAGTPEQQALLDYMSGCTGPMRLATIHKEAGAKGKSNTQKLLGKLVAANLLVKASHGSYELSSRAQQYYFPEKTVDSVDSVENSKAV